MRNIITSIILLVLIILLVVATIWGIKIGSFQILSVSQIKEKNNLLNEKIAEASTLTSIDYPENVDMLEETYTEYTLQKQKYEEISEFANENDNIYETKQYDIGYLWKIFGKYATTRNLTISMDVQTSNAGENLYNLNFAVAGEYVNISQFIADIENNSDLYFRIYNFKMEGSGEQISSSFLVKDVNIDPSTLTQTTLGMEEYSDTTASLE